MSVENTEYMRSTSNSESQSALVAESSSQQQKVMAVEFDVTVKDWWIEGGRLGIPKEFREHLPKPGESIVLIDYEGRMYRSKMHNLWQGVDVGRIDGIKPFYRNHPIVTPGTKLHVKVTGKNTVVVMLGERPARQINNRC